MEAATRITGPSFRAMCVMGWYGNHIMLAGGYTTLVEDEMSYDTIRVLDDEWICAILDDDDDPASASASASTSAASASTSANRSGAGSGPSPQLSSAVDPISKSNPNKSALKPFLLDIEGLLVSGGVGLNIATLHHTPLYSSSLTKHHAPLTTHHSPLTTHPSPLTTHH